ncbi:hypothetical protein D3C81_1477530 [compost metagenome]
MARIDGKQRHVGRQTVLELRQLARHVVGHVGLAQHDHGRHLRRQHDGQIALEAARIEILVQSHHQQRRIDIAGKQLAPAVIAAPRDLRGWG